MGSAAFFPKAANGIITRREICVNCFSALSLLMALIFGADDHNFSVSLDDFALIAHGLYGRSDFHCDYLDVDFGLKMALVLAPPCDAALGEVVGAHFELYGVALDDADIVHAQFPRDIRRDDVPVGEPYLKGRVGEGLDHSALGFDDVVFRHSSSDSDQIKV